MDPEAPPPGHPLSHPPHGRQQTNNQERVCLSLKMCLRFMKSCEERINFYQFIKNNFVEILISLYAGGGICVFLYLHSIAGRYLKIFEREYPVFSINDVLLGSAKWGPFISFILFFFLLHYKKSEFKKPKIISLLVVTLLSIFVLEGFFIENVFNAWNLLYLFILDIIVGFIIYIKYNGEIEFKKFDKIPDINKIEFLKLWHTETIQYLKLLTNTVIIVLIGGLVTAFAPQFPYYQREASQSTGLYLLILNHLILVIYYLIGVWFGILGQLFGRSSKIRWLMSEISNI